MENIKTDYQNCIIQKIKVLREENDISQAKLSEILGISTGQLGNIESLNYQHKYTLHQIFTFCNYLNYPCVAKFHNIFQL